MSKLCNCSYVLFCMVESLKGISFIKEIVLIHVRASMPSKIHKYEHLLSFTLLSNTFHNLRYLHLRFVDFLPSTVNQKVYIFMWNTNRLANDFGLFEIILYPANVFIKLTCGTTQFIVELSNID